MPPSLSPQPDDARWRATIATGGSRSRLRSPCRWPVNTYRFDPADAAFWHAKRLYVSNTFQDTALDTIKGRLEYKVSADDTLSIGGEWRRFANSGYYGEQDNILTSAFQSGKVSTKVDGMPGPMTVIVARTGRSSTSRECCNSSASIAASI